MSGVAHIPGMTGKSRMEIPDKLQFAKWPHNTAKDVSSDVRHMRGQIDDLSTHTPDSLKAHRELDRQLDPDDPPCSELDRNQKLAPWRNG